MAIDILRRKLIHLSSWYGQLPRWSTPTYFEQENHVSVSKFRMCVQWVIWCSAAQISKNVVGANKDT